MTLEESFHEAMLNIHREAKDLTPPYNASGFLKLVRTLGGRATADKLLSTSNPSDGFAELFIRGPENLKLSVEYLVLRAKWSSLFTSDQLEIAERRLKEVDCPLPVDRMETAIPPLPEEIGSGIDYTEGAAKSIVINGYERNTTARNACIAHYGATCNVCNFDFGATYGDEAIGFIHVHHLRPLATCVGEYQVDPIDDLRPVCPNCHAVIHLGGSCRSISEVKAMLKTPRDE